MHMLINAATSLYKLAWMFKTKSGSDYTPRQSDAGLNPASTRCRATIGPSAKRHSNVVPLAGRWWPAFRC